MTSSKYGRIIAIATAICVAAIGLMLIICCAHSYFTGGDQPFTRERVGNRLGQEELVPIREITSGVVLSQIRYREHNYHLLSKSGGFGTKDLLAQLQKIICK